MTTNYSRIQGNTDTRVILKKGEGRMLKAGGAWVFDNEIDRIEGSFENGDIINVRDFDGYDMGFGFINTAIKENSSYYSLHNIRSNRVTFPSTCGFLTFSEKYI